VAPGDGRVEAEGREGRADAEGRGDAEGLGRALPERAASEGRALEGTTAASDPRAALPRRAGVRVDVDGRACDPLASDERAPVARPCGRVDADGAASALRPSDPAAGRAVPRRGARGEPWITGAGAGAEERGRTWAVRRVAGVSLYAGPLRAKTDGR